MATDLLERATAKLEGMFQEYESKQGVGCAMKRSWAKLNMKNGTVYNVTRKAWWDIRRRKFLVEVKVFDSQGKDIFTERYFWGDPKGLQQTASVCVKLGTAKVKA